MLEPSLNGLVTDRNTKLCCCVLIFVLFQNTAANKIDSKHTIDYKKLILVWEVDILQVTVNKIKVLSSFYVDF